MRNKLLWFYQEVNEPEPTVVAEQPKPGPSRTAASTNSKTPQGKVATKIIIIAKLIAHFERTDHQPIPPP